MQQPHYVKILNRDFDILTDNFRFFQFEIKKTALSMSSKVPADLNELNIIFVRCLWSPVKVYQK